ncbi:hypothetical protein P5W98_00685 [Paraburkholderia sp. A1BS-2L]|uniref:hypothetical protein n=1 Tax=Paraburkholderia sp. A1BS-2L TaxID=3028373 RepID=UPI003DA8CC78
MPTMDLWSNAANLQLRQLFGSAMASLLLLDVPTRPIYVCSPWISDFIVFENRFGEFNQLVPIADDDRNIRFSDCLRQLACLHDVRIMSRRTEVTLTFLRNPRLAEDGVKARLADDDLHEKGLLTPIFYFEGSMNITYSGVHRNKEKILYHAGSDPDVAKRMALAYLELDRRWKQLEK